MKRPEKIKDAVEESAVIGPELVMISPTDRCNLNCRTCWRGDKEEKFEVGLSLEKIKEVLDDCERLNVQKIDFTGGGEPFLRDEIFDMIREAKKRKMEVGLTTNTCLLDEEKVRKLVKLNIDEILLSLDGMKETNDFLRGDGVYDDVMKSLGLFERVGFEGTLGFSVVITSQNYDDFMAIAKLAEDKKIDYINFIIMNVWKSNKDLDPRRREEEIMNELKAVSSFEDEAGFDTNADNILEYGLVGRGPPEFCFAPWDMAFVNASGEMMACCTLASYYKNILGNLEDENFYELWTGGKIREFREEIKNGAFQEKCKECLPDFIKKYNKIYRRLKRDYGFKG